MQYGIKAERIQDLNFMGPSSKFYHGPFIFLLFFMTMMVYGTACAHLNYSIRYLLPPTSTGTGYLSPSSLFEILGLISITICTYLVVFNTYTCYEPKLLDSDEHITCALSRPLNERAYSCTMHLLQGRRGLY